jgi:hypothetical protein
MRPLATLALALLLGVTLGPDPAAAQQPVPRPFPRPGEAPPPPEPPPAAPPAVPASPATPASETGDEPDEAMLGLPVYPGSEYLGSYDARGAGQRFYLFGTNIDFAGIVTYYRNVLRQRGHAVFDAPATHVFEIGRFREEMMAFPTSVTVKDYTWNGSEGYLSVRPDRPPTRYRTIIQIVPAP